MILSKIYNSLDTIDKEGLIWGLIWGLIVGLIVGLVGELIGGLIVGLVGELIGGLIVGLVGELIGGLVAGLTGGLICGLIWGLIVILVNWTEALPFLTGFYPIILLILGIIILSEILFWLMPKEKVNKKDLFWHTFKRKIENIFEVLMGLSAITQVYIFIREIAKYYNQEITELILKWLGYIGVGIIGIALIVGIFYVWIKLNSYKYKR